MCVKHSKSATRCVSIVSFKHGQESDCTNCLKCLRLTYNIVHNSKQNQTPIFIETIIITEAVVLVTRAYLRTARTARQSWWWNPWTMARPRWNISAITTNHPLSIHTCLRNPETPKVRHRAIVRPTLVLRNHAWSMSLNTVHPCTGIRPSVNPRR